MANYTHPSTATLGPNTAKMGPKMTKKRGGNEEKEGEKAGRKTTRAQLGLECMPKMHTH